MLSTPSCIPIEPDNLKDGTDMESNVNRDGNEDLKDEDPGDEEDDEDNNSSKSSFSGDKVRALLFYSLATSTNFFQVCWRHL